jgi:uncharacterized repeat protein (TIGR01451 family)
VGKHLTFIGMVLLAALSLLAAAAAAAPTAPGTNISNIAQVEFTSGGLTFTGWSNEENFLVAVGNAPPVTDLRVTKRSSRVVVGVGEVIMYVLRVENVGGDANNVAVQDQLPAELRFRDTVPAGGSMSEFTPVTGDGKLLVFNIGALAAGATVEFAYYAEVVAGSEYGFSTNKAQAFDQVANRASNVAVATVLIRQDFFADVSFVAGRVYAGGCDGTRANVGVAGVRIYTEDGTVVTTDPLGRYHIEGMKPGLHVVQIDKSSLPAGLKPVQCRTNSRNGGDGEAQFVDTQGGALWRADFVLEGTPAPRTAVAPAGQAIVDNGTWTQDRLQKWIETAPQKFDFVAPGEGFYPPLGSVTIVVAHHPDEKVELTLDGEPVSALNIEGTVFNSAKTWAATRWRGVNIHPGDNAFMAVAVDKAGQKGERVGRTLHFSGPPVAAAVDLKRSTLVADGNTPPVIAIKLTSEGNHPARPGTFVDVEIGAPYRRQQIVAEPAPTAGLVPSRFVVGEGGVVLVPLAPTLLAGEVRLSMKIAGEDRLLKAWLSSGTTQTLLVAMAEGTLGANRIDGTPDGKVPANMREDVFADGRIAFFFKSMILGDWLLKAGYDSDRSAKERANGLYKEIEPRRYFPVYGDASRTEYENDTSGPLFVHVERKNFMIRYGDFDTALSGAELARYERRLHGIQTAYRGEEVGFKAFVSDTANKFVKDEIKGNGTSGLYRLSVHPVLINSERIKIEERDRFRNGEALTARSLVRNIDYEIDYEYGTIFFKEPVQSQSPNLNPLVIVADYETSGTGKRSVTAGGRVAAYGFGGNFEVGATAISQGAAGTTGAGELYAIDATTTVAEGTRLHGEFARSRDGPKGPGQGTAYTLEVSHNSKAFSGRLYARGQDEQFGLEQLNGGLSGTREYGVEAKARLDGLAKGLGAEARAYHRESARIAGAREFAEFFVSWTSQDTELALGARRVKDGTGGSDAVTDQILARAVHRIDDRLTVRMSQELSISGKDANADFPTKTTFGADFKLTEHLSLVAAHEIIDGKSDRGSITRAGFQGAFWTGGRVTTTAQRDLTDTSERVFANVGLAQDWQIEEGWSMSASVDRQQRVYGTGEDNGGLAGAGDRESFTAISIGTAVDTSLGKVTARVETRLGTDERWNVAIGHYLSPYANLSFANNVRFMVEDPETGGDVTTAMMQLGVAYRPNDGPLILNRLDFGYDSDPRAEAASGISRNTWKIVDNALINLQPTNDLEVSIMLGVKYAADELMGVRHHTFMTMTGLEARYDITEQIDVGLRGSALSNWTSGTLQYAVGPSIGYAISDAIWVSAGYNLVGYEDDDFTAAGYTSSGLFTQFRARLDSTDAEAAAKWFVEN